MPLGAQGRGLLLHQFWYLALVLSFLSKVTFMDMGRGLGVGVSRSCLSPWWWATGSTLRLTPM